MKKRMITWGENELVPPPLMYGIISRVESLWDFSVHRHRVISILLFSSFFLLVFNFKRPVFYKSRQSSSSLNYSETLDHREALGHEVALNSNKTFDQTYRPKIKIVKEDRTYSFNGVGKTFRHFPHYRIEELSSHAFEEMLISATSPLLRRRARKFMKLTLKIAEKYQVDPLWVLSVMWTESHFNSRARSRAKAVGLMQIMPGTGKYLKRLIKKSEGGRALRGKTINPKVNIEMGVFYLRRLLKRFKGNYKLATVAYNMGPSTVSKRLRLRLPVGVRNRYLNRVTFAYGQFLRPLIQYQHNHPPPYTKTYVVRARQRKDLREGKALGPLEFLMTLVKSQKRKSNHKSRLL